MPFNRRQASTAGLEKICTVKDVPKGGKKYFNVKGREIVILNAEGGFYAIHNWRTHEQGDLSDGTLRGYTLKCPEHGAEFDVKTGKVLLGPDDGDPSSIEPIGRYMTVIQGEDVLVQF